ncbi:MAG: phenylacetate-CoA oxygenase subunit PaaC, partial [Bacteroidetes bacterium]|nr:phenylacetate-CoA oxygenase subunit PaaC [Bacteroidota bacterium]
NKMLLEESKDQRLKEIAAKTIKESTYHLKWSSEWVIRLGDGTETSHLKMQNAVNDLWDYTGEMFLESPTEIAAAESGYGISPSRIETYWRSKVAEILEEATLSQPNTGFVQKGGKTGIHSEHLGYILAEMQFMQRAYPNMEW